MVFPLLLFLFQLIVNIFQLVEVFHFLQTEGVKLLGVFLYIGASSDPKREMQFSVLSNLSVSLTLVSTGYAGSSFLLAFPGFSSKVRRLCFV